MKLFSFALLSALKIATSLKNLEVHITVRDFLPIQCLVEYGKSDQVEQAWGQSATKLIQGNNDACQGLLELDHWTEAFVSGEISGHPDFEAGGLYRNQKFCSAPDPETGLHFPVGTCIFEESPRHTIIASHLEYGSSGLGKPVYCSIDEQCGLVGIKGFRTQSSKNHFNSWYHDDPRFNRRIGQSIELKPKENKAFNFFFNGNEESIKGFPDDNSLNFFGPLDMFKVDGSREINALWMPGMVSAWPQSLTRPHLLSKGFWFTTELHTFFEFRNDKDMLLTFSGDDDFWAFINGKLAVDVGGMHGRRKRSIDLNKGNARFNYSHFLELEHGKTYTLDIFHAERQRDGSNFELETTLFPSCSVSQEGRTRTLLSDNMFMKGITINSANRWLLLSSEIHFQSSFALTKNTYYLNQGLKLEFMVRLGGHIEGFAVIITAQTLKDMPQSTGSTLNVPHLATSLVLRLNLCKIKIPHCQGKTLELSFQGSQSIMKLAMEDLAFGLTVNEAFPMKLIYYGDSNEMIEIYLNNSLLLRAKNEEVATFFRNNSLRFGFVGSSSELAEDVAISNLRMTTIPIDLANSNVLSEMQYDQNFSVCNFWRRLPYKILTFDECGNNYRTGGYKDSFIIRTSHPETHLTLLEDNHDGSYDIHLKVVANYILSKISLSLWHMNENGTMIEMLSVNISLAINASTCKQNEVIADAKITDLTPKHNRLKDMLLYVGISGTSIFFLFFVTFLLVKRRWSYNADFVSKGMKYKLEINTNLASDDDLSKTGYKVLQTQQELNDLAAKLSDDPLQQAMDKLKNENLEMKSNMRDLKHRHEWVEEERTNGKCKKTKKMDF